LRILLCQSNISVNSGGVVGATALMIAIKAEHPEAVEICLKWGSCPYVLNDKGQNVETIAKLVKD